MSVLARTTSSGCSHPCVSLSFGGLHNPVRHARYLPSVLAVRHLRAQRSFVVLLMTATLLLKLLVPSGYMIASEHGRMTIELCSGVVTVPSEIGMPGMHSGVPGHGKTQDHERTEMPCAFAGLSTASLGAIDPVQLSALIAFVIAMGLSECTLPSSIRRDHIRPPLRGPPTIL